MSTIVFILSLLAGLLLPMGVLAHSDDEVFGNHMFGSGMWGGWMFMIIFWVIGITLFILFVRWIVDQGKTKEGPSNKALEIMKERYAKGEINQQEFERMRKDIK